MKKTRISLAIILSLLLTFCFSTVSYADIKENVPQPVSEQQGIEVLRGVPCSHCHNGTMIVTYDYLPYVYSGHSYICTTHDRCTVEVWKRKVEKTRKCNNCGIGATTESTETDNRHFSRL